MPIMSVQPSDGRAKDRASPQSVQGGMWCGDCVVWVAQRGRALGTTVVQARVDCDQAGVEMRCSAQSPPQTPTPTPTSLAVCEAGLKRCATSSGRRSMPVVERVHGMHVPFRDKQLEKRRRDLRLLSAFDKRGRITVKQGRRRQSASPAKQPLIGRMVDTRRACRPRGWGR